MHDNNCNNDKLTGNKDWRENIEIKKVKNNDLILLQKFIEHEKQMILINNDKNNDCIRYENFKLKNEEIDLKFECSDYDDDADQLTLRYDRVDVNQELSSGDPYRISTSKDEEPENYLKINALEEVKKCNCLEYEVDNIIKDMKKCDVCCSEDNVASNKVIHDFTSNIKNDDHLKSIFSAKNLIIKLNFNDHYLLKMHSDKILKFNNSNKKIIKNPFNCSYCLKLYNSKHDLNDHLLKVHKYRTVEKLYNCNQCSYETYCRSYLKKHKNFHNIKEFKCSYCSKEYNIEESLNNHILKMHKIYKCDKCSYENIRRHIVKHMTIHEHIKKFNCSYCLKGYNSKQDLNDHLLKVHKCRNVEKLYNCDQCSYETYNKAYLNKHVKFHKKFKCSYCSKEYNIEKSLDNHLLKMHKCGNVTKKLYKCDKCSYETYIRDHIIKHVTVHNNIKKFNCSYCSKGYSNKSDLDDHLLKVHKCRNGKKLYNCDQCRYETYNKFYLIQHVKSHKNIKDFICSYCSKSYTRKSSLNDHLFIIHKSGNKQKYNCDHCSYETYRKNCLIQHARSHKNIKFQCSYCSKKYSTKMSLDNHLLKSHKDKDTR